MRSCLLCSRQYDDIVQYCPHDGTALPPPDLLVGRVIDGKYRIDSLHGSGGMGAVYRATQVNLERTVALKVVRGDFLKDAIVTERFKREALAVARLKHPHIVTVYDFGIMTDGGAYLVMEFLEGRSLRVEIQNRGRIPIGPAVELMRQICSAVHAAHVEGVIHRDLKPDNIFLERGREGAITVKILDFGVAKLRQNTSELKTQSAELTMSGMMLGTPIYMSPEQCQGDPLDARSDIYSLGCVFYEMVAGRPPFLGSTPSALIIKHASEAPRAPSTFADNIPGDLEEILLKSLSKGQEDRYQTAAEFGSALAGVWVPLDTQVSFPDVSDGGRTSERATVPKAEEIGELMDEIFPDFDVSDRHRLAVLPFRNLRGDKSIDFLTLSLTDSIISELSIEQSLVVRPSAAVEQYVGTTIDQRAVSRHLDVELLVTGNYMKQGDAFQLNAQLIDVAGNEIVWRHRINASFGDIFELQDAIVSQIVAGIRGKLCGGPGVPTEFLVQGPVSAQNTPITPSMSTSTPVPTPVSTARPAPTADPVALDLLRHASELGDGLEERKRAIEMLERAVGMSPDLAPAWTALAARYYSSRNELGRASESAEKARSAAERAVALDRSELGTAVELGRILVETGNAEETARRAAALVAEQPSNFSARFSLAYACRFGGLLDRALREFRLAEQTGGGGVAHEVGTIYLQKHLYTDALRVLDEQNEVAPRARSLFMSALAWTLIGNPAGARDVVGELAKMDPNSIYTLMGQVLLGQLEGRTMSPLLGWLKDIETPNGEVHCWLAQVHAFAGDEAGAAVRLRSAITSGYFNYPYFTTDPLLAKVRATKEAATLLEAARLRHDQFAREFGT